MCLYNTTSTPHPQDFIGGDPFGFISFNLCILFYHKLHSGFSFSSLRSSKALPPPSSLLPPPSSLLPPPSSLLPPPSSLGFTCHWFSFQRRLPGVSIKHSITSYNNTKYIPHRLDKAIQWEEKGPKHRQVSQRHSPLPTVLTFVQESQATQLQNIIRGPTSDPSSFSSGLNSILLLQSL